jgi:non-ribosomal peptide synthetase component E (peptide arylation enzyme)
MNIASHLDHWAQEAAFKAALRAADGDLSYADLNLWSSGIASELAALGLVKGDRVDVLAGSNAGFVTYAAILAAQLPITSAAIRRALYRSLDVDLETQVLVEESHLQGIALHSTEFRQRFAEYRASVIG